MDEIINLQKELGFMVSETPNYIINNYTEEDIQNNIQLIYNSKTPLNFYIILLNNIKSNPIKKLSIKNINSILNNVDINKLNNCCDNINFEEFERFPEPYKRLSRIYNIRIENVYELALKKVKDVIYENIKNKNIEMIINELSDKIKLYRLFLRSFYLMSKDINIIDNTNNININVEELNNIKLEDCDCLIYIIIYINNIDKYIERTINDFLH